MNTLLPKPIVLGILLSENIIVPLTISRVVSAMCNGAPKTKFVGLALGLLAAGSLDIAATCLSKANSSVSVRLTMSELAVVARRFWYHYSCGSSFGTLKQGVFV
jgi:hypothetical protein